jgi:hypothetical protein
LASHSKGRYGSQASHRCRLAGEFQGSGDPIRSSDNRFVTTICGPEQPCRISLSPFFRHKFSAPELIVARPLFAIGWGRG